MKFYEISSSEHKLRGTIPNGNRNPRPVVLAWSMKNITKKLQDLMERRTDENENDQTQPFALFLNFAHWTLPELGRVTS